MIRSRSWRWALLILLVAACQTPEPGKAEAPSPPSIVKVTRPKRGAMVSSITLPGDLVAFSESPLHAKVTGYLKTISVDKGDWVHKGQVLAEIEVPELQQRLRRARATLAVKRVSYERLKGVWQQDSRLVAKEDVDIAEGEFQQAQADVEELEALVAYTQIVAPFDGVVTARFLDPGALVQASGQSAPSGESQESTSGKGGLPVVTVADISTIRVYMYVPERETSMVRKGTPAELRLREFPGREFSGTVARFATSLDLSTRTMLTEVDLENPKHELYPGMYADVTLDLERRPDALQLPSSAVGSDSGGASRFVLVAKGDELVKTPIQVGLEVDGAVEVSSGIDADTYVASDVRSSPQPGSKVRVVVAAAPTASPPVTAD